MLRKQKAIDELFVMGIVANTVQYGQPVTRAIFDNALLLPLIKDIWFISGDNCHQEIVIESAPNELILLNADAPFEAVGYVQFSVLAHYARYPQYYGQKIYRLMGFVKEMGPRQNRWC